LLASRSASVTKRLPLMFWMPKGANPAGRLLSMNRPVEKV
jgi:hypothetical protein